MADTKLKPCPFCGGDELGAGWDLDEPAHMTCFTCHIRFQPEEDGIPLIRWWNTRASTQEE